MTRDKKEFIEAMLTWFRSPQVGNDEELDRKFLASAYDNITQPHWISVNDELPKEHFKDSSSKWVLVCTPLGSVYIDSYNHKNKEWVNNRKSVTHWMPLPAPPHHIIDANKKR